MSFTRRNLFVVNLINTLFNTEGAISTGSGTTYVDKWTAEENESIISLVHACDHL